MIRSHAQRARKILLNNGIRSITTEYDMSLVKLEFPDYEDIYFIIDDNSDQVIFANITENKKNLPSITLGHIIDVVGEQSTLCRVIDMRNKNFFRDGVIEIRTRMNNPSNMSFEDFTLISFRELILVREIVNNLFELHRTFIKQYDTQKLGYL